MKAPLLLPAGTDGRTPKGPRPHAEPITDLNARLPDRAAWTVQIISGRPKWDAMRTDGQLSDATECYQ